MNLIFVAEALFRHRNVSKSAQELNLSQSAVSHALRRLRDHYHDPLFVRISKGIQPTAFALTIQEEIEILVSAAHSLSQKRESFDPAKASGHITVSTTGYFEIVALTKLIPLLSKEAPNVQISVRPSLGELPNKELETGLIDLGIAGYYQDLPEGFYRNKLFSDQIATAYRKNRFGKQKSISIEQFYENDHALLTLQGDFKDNLSRVIEGKRRIRHINYGSSSFAATAWLLPQSDILLTAPKMLLKSYQEYFPIDIVPCPVETKTVEMQMVWHALTHKDPLRRWFRERVKEFCQGL